MSATIAWNDFLQTSGQCPNSFRMPPAWPPMPSAQVLQAFLLRMACHSHRQPTRFAIRSVYLMAAHPPPLVIRFMGSFRSAENDADRPLSGAMIQKLDDCLRAAA